MAFDYCHGLEFHMVTLGGGYSEDHRRTDISG